MSNILEFSAGDYFGVCRKCGHNDGYLNIERNHWFVCHRHKVKWFVGSNLFSRWRNETEDEWIKNASLLFHYREIEPKECPSTWR